MYFQFASAFVSAPIERERERRRLAFVGWLVWRCWVVRMEILQHWWRGRFSFRNATIIICFFNLVTVLLLLQGFLSTFSNRKFSANQPNSVKLRYIKESEEIRRAMEPLELIKRVREIEQEAHTESELVQQKDTKQTAAVDLIFRLNNFRSNSDTASMKVVTR